MQFAVPQFTDVEDKLIGPLTLKQFLILLATGGVVMFFWSILGMNIIFFLFGLPTALLGILIAFSRFNGRPFFSYITPFISFMASPKMMVFIRQEATIPVLKKSAISKKKTKENKPEDLEPAESRLKKLSYFLDQKTEEEKELIEKQLLRQTTVNRKQQTV